VAFVSLTYELINADGTRAVFGNASAAQADPDYIGPVDPENGIQGLLDTAGVRESTSDLVERDGATHGPFYASRRSGTIQGFLAPTWDLDSVQVAVAEGKLKRASRALRADAVLRWTPPNDSSPRQLRVRRQDGPRITGRRPKQWQLTLVSTDVYALGSNEQSVVITAGAAAGETGITNPITDPISTSLNATGQQFVVNQGDAPTWPRFRIDGPITNPQVLNNSTGELLALATTINVGDYLDIYPQLGRILLNGTADRYSALDFAQSEWWQVQPGSNDVRLLASSFSSPAAVTVYFRHAYE
jgi:hypothetical protein